MFQKFIKQVALQQPDSLVKRYEGHKPNVKNTLIKLGINPDSDFFYFFYEFISSGLKSKSDSSELITLTNTGDFPKIAHEIWGIPKNYILFTSGEGEGGYLYNTEDDSVWDFNLGQQQELLNGTLPHWNSFYEFMEWYLDTSEDED